MKKMFQTYIWPKNSVFQVKVGTYEEEIPVQR